MTLIFSCSTKKDNPNFSEKKIQASDSITYSFVNTYLKKIDSLKLYSDTSFHSDYREYPQIRFHIKTIKPHLYKLAFIEIIKNDSADSEVFIFKLNNKNWEYQQTIKSGCRYLFEIFEADVNFDNQNELIIQRAMGGSRSILDHLCFQFNNQTNEIGKHIITITSAYDLELDPKTKSIYIREDGANWYQ